MGICKSLHIQTTDREESNLVIYILLFRHDLYFPTRHPLISSLSSFCASLELNSSLAGPLALSRGNETSKTTTLYITYLDPLTNSSVAESTPSRHDTHKNEGHPKRPTQIHSRDWIRSRVCVVADWNGDNLHRTHTQCFLLNTLDQPLKRYWSVCLPQCVY